jgi:hypothetical protein
MDKEKIRSHENGNSIPIPISATIANGISMIAKRGRGKRTT